MTHPTLNPAGKLFSQDTGATIARQCMRLMQIQARLDLLPC